MIYYIVRSSLPSFAENWDWHCGRGGEVCLGFVVGFKDGIPASLVFFYFAWEGLGGADG